MIGLAIFLRLMYITSALLRLLHNRKTKANALPSPTTLNNAMNILDVRYAQGQLNDHVYAAKNAGLKKRIQVRRSPEILKISNKLKKKMTNHSY